MLKYSRATSLSLVLLSVSFVKEAALAISNPGCFHFLIDTSSGSQLGEGAGRMKQDLQLSGTNPEDITDIVIKYLHSDYIGEYYKPQ